MSAPCIKRFSMIIATVSAVAVLTLLQPVADGEIDGLFAGTSDQSSVVVPVGDFGAASNPN